jgi:hypothetical protein
MPKYQVAAEQLNLRRSPKKVSTNILCALPHQHSVEVVDTSNPVWWKVKTSVSGMMLEGYVFKNFLEPKVPGKSVKETGSKPPEADLGTNPKANLNSKTHRHCRLSSNGAPTRNPNDKFEKKVTAITAIINYLDVEKSARYEPQNPPTFCNIYAYDVCCLANVYLPRVWWTGKALRLFAQGKPVEPRYAETVTELNANSLHEWLKDWGNDYGWQRTFDLTELQTAANKGNIGLITAKRIDLNRSGHIVCVLPETNKHKAKRRGEAVSEPLQSQAGVTNKKIFTGTWYLSTKYSENGFWIHE